MPAEVITIQDPATGSAATVLVSQGFNCFSWRPAIGGQPHEMLWAEEGFESGENRATSSGTPLLFPFAGRIEGGAFEYGGKRYEIERRDAHGNSLHGFAFDSVWRVTDRIESAVTAEFQPSIDRPEALPQWTGDYRLRATYRVEAGRLELDFSAENLGDGPLPFGFGAHPYFRLPLAEGSDPEQTVLRAGVDGEWEDEGLIPTGVVAPIAADAPLPTGAPLGGRGFDTPFRMIPGVREAELFDPASGVRVRQEFDDSMTCCVIYTPPHRGAICIEPYTAAPNAFGLEAAGVASGLREIAPGESYTTRVTHEATRAGGTA